MDGLPPSPGDALPREAVREIEELYDRLTRDLAGLGVGCWAHGDCCDFRRCDHRLYASSLEIAYVQEKRPGPYPGDSRLCPFWKDGRCTERERRPLGCRTYHCDSRYREFLEDLHERYYRELRGIVNRHALPHSYRLFVEAIREPRAAPVSPTPLERSGDTP